MYMYIDRLPSPLSLGDPIARIGSRREFLFGLRR